MMFNSDSLRPSLHDVHRPVPTPSKPRPAAPLSRIFADDARIAGWTARRNEEAAIAAVVRRELPRPLAERIRITGARDSVVEITVSSGAVAASVRQRSSDLAAALRREGWDCTEIRIRVQVESTPGGAEKPVPRQLDAQASRLFDLAAHLPGGPLRDALDRWSRRARGRSSR
jgi:hypothetical protein